MTDAAGTCGVSYDNMDRLTRATTAYSFLPGRTITNSYGYDAASNRTSATLDGTTVNYAYDTLNRLSTLTSGFAGQFTFGYDGLSRRTSLNRPNAVNTTYTYDSVSRLLSVLHQLGTTTIDGASYGLDPAGNRVSKTNYIDGSNENYAYDALYQLTQVLHNGTTSESYTYDQVGNRLSSLGTPSYTYNTSNEVTVTSTATFSYDNNGNRTSKTDAAGTTNYAWDFENRLVSVTLPGGGGTVTFQYDPFGRRIQKSSAAGTIVYAYDGANVVEELNSAGTVTALYAQGAGVDEPLATNRGGALAFYEADGLGSVTSLTNNAGSPVATYTRDAFGNPVTTADPTVNNPFRYTARDYDSETSLYYHRARYYDPGMGRFLAEDPVGVGGAISPFVYTENNPVFWADPFGLQPRLPRCPSTRQIILTRDQLNSLIGPLSAADSANLDRGCIGMTSAYQGANATFPENACGTECFASEAQARARRCDNGKRSFIFAKQGYYEHGRPKPGPNGEVPNDTISSAGGHYNYVVAFPGGCYGWMNNGIYPGSDPQLAEIARKPPKLPGYPHTIWCSTCRCGQ